VCGGSHVILHLLTADTFTPRRRVKLVYASFQPLPLRYGLMQ